MDEKNIGEPVSTPSTLSASRVFRSSLDPRSTYRTGFFILIFIVGLLGGMLYSGRGSSSTDEIGRLAEYTETNLPTPTPIERSESLVPQFPSDTGISTPTPTVTPTPSISYTTLSSVVCPVQFTVEEGRIFIPSRGQYAVWQVRESTERFLLLPRSEEVNGKKVNAELRLEGQQYGNPEVAVSVQCQDNHNHWSQADYFSWIPKSSDVADVRITMTQKWIREVGVMNFRWVSGNYLDTLWTFSTVEKLYHAKPIVYNQAYRTDVMDVFESMRFNR
ncbi:MAG: hypothetical protein Q7S76_03145 [bacterium]|nr:hypothetical protein [bacterium]